MQETKRSSFTPKRAQATVETRSLSEQTVKPPLPLSPALRAQQALHLQKRLLRRITGHLDLTITDNRAVMITVRRDPPRQRYTVRLHHLFSDGPEEIIDALARYIVLDDRKASRALGYYIDLNDHRVLPSDPASRRSPRRSPQLRLEGHHHDLRKIFDDLNTHYFKGSIRAKITWGRNASRGRARHTVRLGSYTVEEQLVRIHPGLDQSWVPDLYLRWVVFHEMLHAALPIPVVNGRRRFHTADFAAAENRFEGLNDAKRWESRNLPALLRI